MIASILRQLLQKVLALPADERSNSLVSVQAQYEARGKKQSRPSLADSLGYLRSVSSTFTDVFVLVDALDECKEQGGTRAEFISALQEMRSCVHLLVTSRRLNDIQSGFHEDLHLEITASDQCVADYVRLRMASTPRLQRQLKKDPVLEEALVQTVAEKCHGM